MALNKVNYVDNQTIITAQNLNNIQDEIIKNTKLIKNATLQNLLDNSNFKNPINQRGITSITANNAHFIDRWFTNIGTDCGIISVNSSGVTLAPTENNYVSITQRITEDESSITGKRYTIAVCVNDKWECWPFTMCEYGGGKELDCGVWIYSIPSWHVHLRWYNESGASVTIQQVALYEGEYTIDTLPEYQPKGYAAELAECQRYYYQSWNSADWDGKTVVSAAIPGFLTREAFATSRLFGVEMPVEMRIPRPSITIYTTRGVRNAVSDYTTGSIIIDEIVEVYYNNKNFIPGTNTAKFTVGTIYAFHYSVSADL